ncbi:MAG: alpha-glucosidase [Chloroflexi bacterium]|nr:alpha-glucosidase [Chloroflexota bacterium]
MTESYLWWRDGVIYQIYPRSFMDSNGDGIGDLRGIISKLDYVASLGVDAIWLSPINVSPMRDFGYDVADYENIDPSFGTMQDFELMLSEAHQRGLKIMLDLVINHTSDQHAWFKESRSSRDNPKADWYIWKDQIPNNWAGAFGGSGWQWDEKRKQFYFHAFLKEQPDLNWRNADARRALMDVMRYWFSKGVDGFRLDVVNAYYKDAQFRSNPRPFSLNPFKLGSPFLAQTHLYDRDQPELYEAYREMRSITDSYPERAMLGEMLGDDPTRLTRYTDHDQLHLIYSPAPTETAWRPDHFHKLISAWDAATASNPEARVCYLLSNHDRPRHVSRYGNDSFAMQRAKVAAMLLFTLRGTPSIYMGEEIAMPDAKLSRSELQDPASKTYYPFYNRDGARTPMQWAPLPHAGFTNGKPWLRVGETYQTINVANQNEDPDSVLNFYRALMRFRKGSLALRRGAFSMIEQKSRDVLMYQRKIGDRRLVIALNFFAREAVAQLPKGKWKRVFPTRIGGDTVEGALRLTPFEASIYEESDH